MPTIALVGLACAAVLVLTLGAFAGVYTYLREGRRELALGEWCADRGYTLDSRPSLDRLTAQVRDELGHSGVWSALSIGRRWSVRRCVEGEFDGCGFTAYLAERRSEDGDVVRRTRVVWTLERPLQSSFLVQRSGWWRRHLPWPVEMLPVRFTDDSSPLRSGTELRANDPGLVRHLFAEAKLTELPTPVPVTFQGHDNRVTVHGTGGEFASLDALESLIAESHQVARAIFEAQAALPQADD